MAFQPPQHSQAPQSPQAHITPEIPLVPKESKTTKAAKDSKLVHVEKSERAQIEEKEHKEPIPPILPIAPQAIQHVQHPQTHNGHKENKPHRDPKTPVAPLTPIPFQPFQHWQQPQMPVPVIGASEYIGFFETPSGSGSFEHFWSVPIDVDGGTTAYGGGFLKYADVGSFSFSNITFESIESNGGIITIHHPTQPWSVKMLCARVADGSGDPLSHGAWIESAERTVDLTII